VYWTLSQIFWCFFQRKQTLFWYYWEAEEITNFGWFRFYWRKPITILYYRFNLYSDLKSKCPSPKIPQDSSLWTERQVVKQLRGSKIWSKIGILDSTKELKIIKIPHIFQNKIFIKSKNVLSKHHIKTFTIKQ